MKDADIISEPLTGKAAEDNNRKLRKLILEASANIKASGVTEEEIDKVLYGSDCH